MQQGTPTLTEPSTAVEPLPAAPPVKKRLSRRQIVIRTAAILTAIAISVGIAFLASKVDIAQLRTYGLLGVFVASLISNATIALPVPGLAVTIGTAAALPNEWWLVALVAGLGEAIGEITGYLAGFGGRAVIENRQLYTRLQYWMEHHGMLTIFVLSAIPNPLIDLAGMTAGASKYTFHKFFFACLMGKTVKTMFFAWAAAQSMGWINWFLTG